MHITHTYTYIYIYVPYVYANTPCTKRVAASKPGENVKEENKTPPRVPAHLQMYVHTYRSIQTDRQTNRRIDRLGAGWRRGANTLGSSNRAEPLLFAQASC